MTARTEEIFRKDSYQRECEAVICSVGDGYVCLDRTVFYPEGGGQPGDTGVLIIDEGEYPVNDTRKGERQGEIRHYLDGGISRLKAGDKVIAKIDWERRYRHMRVHTCLHLLGAVIPAPVTGGAIGDGYGRLDFDLPESPDKEQVNQSLNSLVQKDQPVSFHWITDEELDAQPELVRTMSVQPPRGSGKVRLIHIADVDLQPCGGTHVSRTGEIGSVDIAKIEKKGKRNRRVRVKLVHP